MQTLPDALAAMRDYAQWVLWTLVPSKTRPGKTDKLPINPITLGVCNAQDPGVWLDVDTALRAAANLGPNYGVGFVFTDRDPFHCGDLDDCIQPDNTFTPVATEITQAFAGAYQEISASGRGLHIIGTGAVPEHSCRNKTYGVEFYHTGRFIALTGNWIGGTANFDCTSILPWFVHRYFPPGADKTDEEWREEAVEEWSGPEDDTILISKALSAKSAAGVFGSSVTFEDLWMNNVHALAQAFPTQNQVDPYDRSSADASLAQRLAFWTGKNHARMERLMRMSALVREKWDRHTNYMRMTVCNAVNQQTDVAKLKGDRPPPVVTEPGQIDTQHYHSEPYYVSGRQVIYAQQLAEHFKGCVYVQDIHRVFTPNGSLMKPDQFKAIYGGREFAMDTDNEKTTKNAFEAFTENHVVRLPKVNSTCFRPETGSGNIIEEEGRYLLNVYVPFNTPRQTGDATPFITHLRKLTRTDEDFWILLTWMACCVRYPGVKFQWSPVLISEAEGNGKSILGDILAHAVGQRYTHKPSAEDLNNKFNGWMQNKLLIIIEEIYMQGNRQMMDILKPLQTNRFVEVQMKGADQFMIDNRANFMAFSNHLDSIPITEHSRRWAPMFCPQQTREDVLRDMGPEYLDDLWDWMRNKNGYAIACDYLLTCEIKEEYNPATTCFQAPRTSSTREVIEISRGAVEQEIMEAVGEERPGFRGGWISSQRMYELLQNIGAARKIPPRKRRELLKTLGYDWHPGLNDGRVNNVIPQEGAKPKLFIKMDHADRSISDPVHIVQAYCNAQGYAELTAASTFDNVTKLPINQEK